MSEIEYLKEVLIPSLTDSEACMCLAFLAMLRGFKTLQLTNMQGEGGDE